INYIRIQNKIDTSTSIVKFFFTFMSAFAEMEADLFRERVISGLQAAKENGVTIGRPVKNKNIDQEIDQFLYTDKSIKQIAIENEKSRPTVYRYLKTRNVPLRP
ncbi:recombinase family protein, partial [Enterococcus faecalis]|uniref:recombinase family protein n=1 Tax=Enterococcus faecalis TaxID=1351 RepID=UPI003CC5F746